MDLGQEIFRKIELFDFTSFFGLDFLKFSGPLLCTYLDEDWPRLELCKLDEAIVEEEDLDEL